MKIKHFQGYGCVNAKRLSKKSHNSIYGEKVTTLTIEVWGNHEWGLVMSYPSAYDVYNWLVKRFDRAIKDYQQIVDIRTRSFYKEEMDDYSKCVCDVEHCVYTITYKDEKGGSLC